MFPERIDEPGLGAFQLKLVKYDGLSCASCHWTKTCTGCCFDLLKAGKSLEELSTLAVDWDPEFLSRYFDPFSLRDFTDHASVSQCKAVEIQSSSTLASLKSCFDKFGEEEELDFKCEKCGQEAGERLRKVSKKLYLNSCPPLLMIQLKRFTWDGKKVHTTVKFPLRNLSLKSLMLDSPEDIDSYSYDLIAVANHLGAAGEYGHYIAYINAGHDHSWYCFDDDCIREMEESSVITPHAYMLFYQRNDVSKGNLSFLDFWGTSDWEHGREKREILQKDYQAWFGSETHEKALGILRQRPEISVPTFSSEDCQIL
jgi:uncharacterized UBP type Zn finger protein